MQVTKTKLPAKYEPINISITLESAEEQHLLYDMLCWNQTIPDLVVPNDADKKAKLLGMMNKIRQTIF